MAEAWLYNDTDFGEGRGRSPQPVLRAVVEVATPQAPATFQAVIGTGGPITVIAGGLLDAGDPIATCTTMMLRLGGATNEVPIYELTLEVRPPSAIAAGRPIAWRGVVDVLDPWPMQRSAVLLGQAGFLDAFTVTFAPMGSHSNPLARSGLGFPLPETRGGAVAVIGTTSSAMIGIISSSSAGETTSPPRRAP